MRGYLGSLVRYARRPWNVRMSDALTMRKHWLTAAMKRAKTGQARARLSLARAQVLRQMYPYGRNRDRSYRPRPPM